MENNSFEEVNNGKNKTKRLMIIIVILVILLLGVVGYVCYDKFLTTDKETVNNKVSNNEKNEIKKVDDATIEKLYDTLVAKDGNYGFYFGKNVTIDNISAEEIMPYVLTNYAREHEFTFSSDLQCAMYPDGNDEYCASVNVNKETATKTQIDEYVKKLFNTERDFTLKANDEESKIYSRKLGKSVSIFMYDLNKKIYYFGMVPSEGLDDNIYRSFTKSEQKDEYVYIYDTAFMSDRSGGGVVGYSDIEGEDSIFEYSYNLENMPSFITSDGIDSDYVFANYKDKLNNYKHTFKLADDRNYYWVSSEIVK